LLQLPELSPEAAVAWVVEQVGGGGAALGWLGVCFGHEIVAADAEEGSEADDGSGWRVLPVFLVVDDRTLRAAERVCELLLRQIPRLPQAFEAFSEVR